MQTATRPRPRRHHRQPMTETEARHFPEGERETSAARFIAARDGRIANGVHPSDCTCEPYRDAYTFGRWLAQGWHVCKGAKACVLPLYRNEEDDDGNKTGRRFRTRSYVFCRCQVSRQRGQRFGYAVTGDQVNAERAKGNGNGTPKRETQQPEQEPETPAPPVPVSLPKQWLDQLMYEANQNAGYNTMAPGVTNYDELRHLNACLRARYRLAVWAPGATMDPLDVANRVHDALEPAGVGVALVRELTPEQADKCERAGVQCVNVGEIDFGAYRAGCSVIRIRKV